MLTTRIRTVLAVAAAAVAVLATGVSAAPAQAAVGTMSAKLTISHHKPGHSNVAVFGVVKMTRREAQIMLDRGYRVVMRLWGEDPVFDDLLIGPYSPQFGPSATAQGLEFHRVMIGVDNRILDEDPEGFDELYVGARLVAPNGHTIRSVETSRWYGDF